MKTYTDIQKDGYVERTFSKDIPERWLMWHRDERDREVEVIGETDWKFQFDNLLPQDLFRIFIPKEKYHRIIKGTGDLKIKIYER